ncbi:MAG TPA: SAM-dependent methyltransferase [Geminicoccaceae bacterium]|nr:SAM-dependent methyltransferase [Geminicoccaceae bacterium]
MSALEAAMIEEIRRAGPISTARFMALALSHPTLGYYARHDPLGASGDFVTAPEISQAFGELLGLWLAQAWTDLGRPEPCLLVELGPGRGTLMADLLRAAAQVPGFRVSLRLHLVETSARLRSLQRARLAGESVRWHAALDEVPAGPMLLVANEFLDALPVHQLVATERGWRERMVGLAGSELAFTLSDRPPELARRLPASERALGAIAEVGPLRSGIAAAIGRRLAADGGVALLIDYGAWTELTGDTLQAVRDHAPWPVLRAPGEADLSSHVDFRALAEAAADAGAAAYGPVPQGPFLRAMGIDLRVARLLRDATPAQRRELRAALFRLTDAGAMGELFKVLALARPDAPPPPGFSAPTLTPGAR